MYFPVYMDGAPEGPWMGHVLSEPGCLWLAPTKSEAVERASVEIAAFHAWLRSHGEIDGTISNPSELVLEVVEAEEIPRFGQSGAAVGFFTPDLTPVTEADITKTIRRLGYARRDLLEALAGIPQEALDWVPPNGKRTIRQNLTHIYNCQGWYLSRVLGWARAEAALPDPWPQDTFACMNWVLERAVTALYDLPPALREGVYEAEQPLERWTARKMLRRFVEHEREHVLVVRRTIEWWRMRNG